eukprot:15429344-Alexandrium_andersonii.AAC.1
MVSGWQAVPARPPFPGMERGWVHGIASAQDAGIPSSSKTIQGCPVGPSARCLKKAGCAKQRPSPSQAMLLAPRLLELRRYMVSGAIVTLEPPGSPCGRNLAAQTRFALRGAAAP